MSFARPRWDGPQSVARTKLQLRNFWQHVETRKIGINMPLNLNFQITSSWTCFNLQAQWQLLPGDRGGIILLLPVKQRVCYHIITSSLRHYYFIITKRLLITHFYIFRSPELANDISSSWRPSGVGKPLNISSIFSLQCLIPAREISWAGKLMERATGTYLMIDNWFFFPWAYVIAWYAGNASASVSCKVLLPG